MSFLTDFILTEALKIVTSWMVNASSSFASACFLIVASSFLWTRRFSCSCSSICFCLSIIFACIFAVVTSICFCAVFICCNCFQNASPHWRNKGSSKIVSKLFLNYVPSMKPFSWVLRIDSYQKFSKTRTKSWSKSITKLMSSEKCNFDRV